MAEHPFQPGARVAIKNVYSIGRYNEAFVAKVYKNGNFVLKDSQEQWRASKSYYDNKWSAERTGHYWANDILYLWDSDFDKVIQEEAAAEDHRRRFHAMRAQIKSLIPERITPQALATIEAALMLTEQEQGEGK